MENYAFYQKENRRSKGVTARQIGLSICLIIFSCACFAQDIIITRDSKRIEAKVTEINVDNIRYRQFNNLDGPLYSIPKSDVVRITFQNGLTQTFDEATAMPTQSTSARTQATATPDQTTSTRTQSSLASTQSNQPYYPAQRRLTTAETLAEMQRYYPALYTKYNAGRRMKSAGWTLTGIGLGAMFLGAAVSVSGEENGDDDQIAAGTTIISGGIILAAVGIPITIVGGGQRRRAINAFNSQYYASERPNPYFQLNLYPNRLGLAYVF